MLKQIYLLNVTKDELIIAYNNEKEYLIKILLKAQIDRLELIIKEIKGV